MNNIPASRIRRALCAVAACCALCGMSTTPALAGQGCADTALSANTLITAMDTAQRISAILDELGSSPICVGACGS